MNKLAKRTLAILLVVCALFGLVAMPAAALAEPTVDSPKTYVYDFSDLSQTITAEQGAEPMWKYSSDSVDAPKYGFGNQRLDKAGNAQYWMNDFYEVGYRNGNTEAEPIYYYKDLDWRVVAVTDNSTQTVNKSGASVQPTDPTSTADMDRVQVGGYYQGDETKKHTFNGLRFMPYTVVVGEFDDGSERRTAKETPGHWVAITIKAPEVGTYTVSLDHLKTKYGAQASTAYIIPGAVSDVTAIEGYISDDTYKLENSFNCFESLANIDASEDKLTGLPETNDERALADNTILGTVTLSEPEEEYTLVFKADKNRGGTTTADCARVYLEALIFTQQAEAPVTLGNNRNYSFALNTYIDDGTFTNQTYFETEGYAEKLDALYNTLGWDFLGSTFTSYNRIDKNYLYLNGGGTNSAPAYVAFKLKSPGNGAYQLDFTGYIMTKPDATSTTKAKTSHMWMDALIVKLDENKVETAYADYIATAEEIGTYDPDYSTEYSSTNQYISNTLGTYTFEEGADYILYLRRNPETDSSTTDGDDTYAPNNAYPRGLTATALPATAATIGENVTPAEDAAYATGMGTATALGSYMNTLQKTGAQVNLLDGTKGIALNTKSNTWRFFRSNSALTEAALASGTYAYNADLINKAKELYAAGEMDWQVLDFVSGGADIRYDANTIILYTLKGNQAKHQGVVGSTVAMLIRSPGEGNFKMSFDMSCQYAAGYKTANLWLNAYMVKVDGETVTADNFKNVMPETPIGEITEEYFHDGSASTSSITTTTPMTVKGDVNKTEVEFYFEEGADYILYLQGHEDADTYKDTTITEGVDTYSAGNIYLGGINFECTDEADEKVEYTTLTAALAAAEGTTEIIKLQQDVLLSEVVIPAGVTLDLNGHTLTTAAVGPMGKIVGEGVVKTYAGANTFTNADVFAENTLPLYDEEVGGYKFYEYTLGNGTPRADAANDAVKFWYQFQFVGDKAAEAYELVASGTSGLTLGVTLAYNGETQGFDFVNSKEAGVENDAAAFAAAYAAFAKDATDPWLYVNVRGVSGVENLSVTPVINVGGTYITGAAIAQ